TGRATRQTLQGLADGREYLGIGRTRLANRVADTRQIIRSHGATSARAPDDRAARQRIRRSRAIIGNLYRAPNEPTYRPATPDIRDRRNRDARIIEIGRASCRERV